MACLRGRKKGHGIALRKGDHISSSLCRKLADRISQHPRTLQVDGTVFDKSGNHISIFFRRPRHSELLKASKVGSSASSFYISKLSARGKDTWGKLRRRHGSCAVLWDDHIPLGDCSQIRREVGKSHKVRGAEVRSFHSGS